MWQWNHLLVAVARLASGSGCPLGGWEQLHRVLLDRVGHAERIDWSRVCVDSSSVRAKRGATRRGATRLTEARREQNAGALWAALR